MARTPSPSDSPRLYRWIVDGHNLLLSTREWAGDERLGSSAEARTALTAWVESFARAAGVEVDLVFDGSAGAWFQEAWERPRLRVRFTDPPAEADDQIVLLAAAAVRAGQLVCVVSSDRRTLGQALPESVRLLSTAAFRRLHARVVRVPEKWVGAEDLDEIERHFLSRSPFASDRAASGQEPPAGSDAESAGDPQGRPKPDPGDE